MSLNHAWATRDPASKPQVKTWTVIPHRRYSNSQQAPKKIADLGVGYNQNDKEVLARRATIKTQEMASGTAYRKNWKPCSVSVGMENGAAAVQSVAVTQRLKIDLTQDPAVPFLCIPKRTESALAKQLSLYPRSRPHHL